MYLTDSIRFDEARRGPPGEQGLQDIAEALEQRGIDAPAALYDEALNLASEGHLGQARDRLRMLLCLDPHDAEAHLLLAKVFAAQGRWADAQAQADEAAACGARVPRDLQESIEAGRDAERTDARADRAVARTTSELSVLREEVRKLRSENARMDQLTWDLTRRLRRWTATTTVVSVSAVLLVGLAFSSASSEPAPAPEPVAAAEPAAPAPEPAAPAVPSGTYVVQPGDTLSKVAQKVWGRSSRWQELRDANQSVLKGRTDLQVGMVLTIPE